jgi:hypothetical protein
MTTAEVHSIAVDPTLGPRFAGATGDFVVLPFDETDGVGCYSEASIVLPKEARSAGLDASFLHDAEHRTFEIKKSAIHDAVISLFIGIASNGGWDWIVHYFSSSPSLGSAKRMKLKVYETTGDEVRAWELSGSGPDVVEALRILRNDPR